MTKKSCKVLKETTKASRRSPRKALEGIPEQKTYQDTFGFSNFSLSPSQKALQNTIRENIITFVEGVAGTGKTLAALHYAVQLYLQDKSKEIVIIRTPVESAGRDRIGFLPGDLTEKMQVHFESTRKILIDLLNRGKVESDLGKRIHFKVPNYALGCTFDNACIIIDETQQIEPLILKLLLERIGQNSICIVLGDSTQIYTKDVTRNALKDALERFFEPCNGLGTSGSDAPGYPSYPDIGYHKFTVEDVQRSAIVKTVIKAYAKED